MHGHGQRSRVPPRTVGQGQRAVEVLEMKLKAGEVTVPLFNNAFSGHKVLITGHTGFKGSWLATWLTKLGAEVCGYSNGIPTTPSLFEASSLRKSIRHEL